MFTAEDSGAIEPGDNPPVAFFTQLSDVILDDDICLFFCVSRLSFFDGTKKRRGVMSWHFYF